MAEPAAPKLLTQVRRAVRVRQFSRRTEEAYAAWVRRFVRYHGMRHPAELGAAEVERFLADLAERQGLGGSSQTQALSALLFLYRVVLRRELAVGEIPRAKGIVRIPVVLTRAEVRVVLDRLRGTPRLVALLLYGSGLRLLDVDRLAATLRAELDRAGHEGEQRVVATTADTLTRVEVRAALTDEDLARVDLLATETLDAEELCVRVATVAGRGRTLLVCHVSSCLRS